MSDTLESQTEGNTLTAGSPLAAGTQALTVTENAARRVKALIAMEDDPALKLRISVSGGGCSGFQYAFALDQAVNDDDQVLTAHGVTVLVDEVSVPFLQGATLDYVEDLMGASFRVTNPNANATCGCGNSFAV